MTIQQTKPVLQTKTIETNNSKSNTSNTNITSNTNNTNNTNNIINSLFTQKEPIIKSQENDPKISSLIDNFNKFNSLDFNFTAKKDNNININNNKDLKKVDSFENKQQGGLKDLLASSNTGNNDYSKGKKPYSQKYVEYEPEPQPNNLKDYLNSSNTNTGNTKTNGEKLVNALGKKSIFVKKYLDFDEAFPELK